MIKKKVLLLRKPVHLRSTHLPVRNARLYEHCEKAQGHPPLIRASIHRKKYTFSHWLIYFDMRIFYVV